MEPARLSGEPELGAILGEEGVKSSRKNPCVIEGLDVVAADSDGEAATTTTTTTVGIGFSLIICEQVAPV